MNPKYCVSLETAKRMKELGFPQETDFYWDTSLEILLPKDLAGQSSEERESDGRISAFHVGELGEWLPKLIEGPDNASRLEQKAIEEGWQINYFWFKQSLFEDFIEHENEAEARALMLIYLAENNLLSPSALLSK